MEPKKAANGREINPDFKLTAEHFDSMAGCINGADVYGYTDARLLREVETHKPELIEICAAQNAPSDGAKKQPYFGAILTKAGKKEVKEWRKENKQFKKSKAE